MRAHLADINAELRISLAIGGWVDPISHRNGLACMTGTYRLKH